MCVIKNVANKSNIARTKTNAAKCVNKIPTKNMSGPGTPIKCAIQLTSVGTIMRALLQNQVTGNTIVNK